MIEPLICPSLCVDPQVSRLVLTTFIDFAKLWDEEIFALGQLNRLGRQFRMFNSNDYLDGIRVTGSSWTGVNGPSTQP